MSLRFSGFCMKARHLGHRFEEKVFKCIKYSNILAILSYFWLILLMMRHCTAYGCSTQSNKVGWENLSWHKHRFCYMARAGSTEHLNTCSSSEKYAFGGMFPCTICLSSLLSLLIVTQMPHFHALSHGNHWTTGSTVITTI